MQANELRTENLVLKEGLIYEIYSVNTEGEIQLYKSDEHTKEGIIIDCQIDDIKPIELTETLISEICFNENKVMGLYRLKLNADLSISFSIENDMIYIGDDIEIRISETLLHQLQNLYFALTGEELKIDLS